MGSVLEAAVASVKPFGLFVRLKGYRANGLVHLSQVGLGCLDFTALGHTPACQMPAWVLMWPLHLQPEMYAHAPAADQ